MQEGIKSSVTEEDIAEYLINEGYPDITLPVSCVLSGSRAYGLALPSSDRDYVGIHLLDTYEILEHPDFRARLQVIREKFTSDLEEVPIGVKGGDISLDSFEFWKFLSLTLKGSFVAYEILHLPEIHHNSSFTGTINLLRGALTNKIGKAAKGNALHDWRRDKRNKKKAIMAYYRLLQAIHFLREEEFEWRADYLWDYVAHTGRIGYGTSLLASYMKEEERTIPVEEELTNHISYEIENLIEEVNRALVITKLPDQCPRQVLDAIRHRIKHHRAALI